MPANSLGLPKRLARSLFLLLVFTLMEANSRVEAADRGKGKGQKWAVLIGVDDYTELRKLHYSGNDQRALAEQLVASGFPKDNVFVLHDKAGDKRYIPFRSNIEKQIDLVIKLAEKEDLVIVGFSGHGVQLDGKSFLCPEDAQINKLAATIIPLDAVYDRLGKCKALLRLLLVDACRNDVVPEGRKGIALARGLGDFRGADEQPPEGILLLSSCAPGQFSMEDSTLQHGVFMHYVIEGLHGKASANGAITLAGLYDYASLNTKRHVARQFNEFQTPALKGEVNGPFEICTASRGGIPADVTIVGPASERHAASVESGSKHTVWVYKSEGGRWVKQAERTLNTDDTEAARKYVAQVKAVKGWTATTDLPEEQMTDMSGTWSGSYSYDDPKRPTVPFSIDFRQTGNVITATVSEPHSDFGEAATLEAVVVGKYDPTTKAVSFTKNYTNHQGEPIHYSGTIAGQTMTGKWNIKNYTGTFSMKLSPK